MTNNSFEYPATFTGAEAAILWVCVNKFKEDQEEVGGSIESLNVLLQKIGNIRTQYFKNGVKGEKECNHYY